MIELETSTNILDRQRYSAWLKEIIDLQIKALESELDEDIIKSCRQREYIKILKNKLSNYDIYNQKVPYTCMYCGQKDCICEWNNPE